MKKLLAIFTILALGTVLFAQQYVFRIDSISNGEIYYQEIKLIPDTSSNQYTKNALQKNIRNSKQFIKFWRSEWQSQNAQIQDTTYTSEFREALTKKRDQSEYELRIHLYDKQRLVAIKDSAIAYIERNNETL